MIRPTLYSLLSLVALTPCTVFGATLYSDGLDSASADVTVVSPADTSVDFIDYSSFTVGATNFSLPEAPNMVAGSAATSGVLIRANIANGAGIAANVIAGATPLVFSGDYTLSFDSYMNFIEPTAGSTEQLVWGVASTADAIPEGRVNRNAGATGVYGWLASENGYGSEDAAIFEDNLELADLGDTQPGEAAPFNDAFTTNLGLNDVPANTWNKVEIEVVGNTVTTKFNGVVFFSETVADTTGSALFGYEDPFGSVGNPTDNVWAVFDNFVVTSTEVVPEPTSALLLCLASLGMVARRR